MRATVEPSIARIIFEASRGKTRIQGICDHFGLDSKDRNLLVSLMAEWQPGYTFEDIVSVCGKYSSYSNIGRIMQAFETIASETAQVSTLRRLNADGFESPPSRFSNAAPSLCHCAQGKQPFIKI